MTEQELKQQIRDLMQTPLTEWTEAISEAIATAEHELNTLGWRVTFSPIQGQVQFRRKAVRK